MNVGGGSWGSQPLSHHSALVLFPFFTAIENRNRRAWGKSMPWIENHPTLDHQERDFYYLLFWVSFTSFLHS